ncbi:3-deoxy-manno-octulosonate cytidylyltransferase [Alphaproteobacteria bacterium]|nr:3-deoxy-manno-octulosonate cytidylyltransferase [Alphaproteobacteria bacterium]
MNTAIIIPARMASQRFPNKPMVNIDGVTMIERVWNQAVKASIGDVFVACCEKEVFDLVTSKGGKAIMTDPNLNSGTDRVYAAFSSLVNKDDYESIINLQGDMPLIEPANIQRVNLPLKNGYDIGTIATNISKDEENNENITKVSVKWNKLGIVGNSIDFYKYSKKELINIYQHVGIYSFTPLALKKFVSLPPSKKEIDRKLEQLRALDAGINIGITFVENVPISVDTIEDLILIENIIKRNNENN